jgi:hypothetical protein
MQDKLGVVPGVRVQFACWEELFEEAKRLPCWRDFMVVGNTETAIGIFLVGTTINMFRTGTNEVQDYQEA